MTDDVNVYMRLNSPEKVGCRLNFGETMGLVLRCREKTTSAYFVTGCHMASGHSDWGKVTYRIDDEKARSASMTASTDHRALGLWGGSTAIPFIKSLFGKSQLIVRMTPYSESPISGTFAIAGVEKAIEPLRKACNW